jgi:DNA-binding MarR family transcriptional regulator
MTARKSAAGRAEKFPPLTVTRPALLVDGSDNEFRDLLDALLGVASQLQTLRLRIAEMLGVTPPQYRILMTVAQAQGEIGVSVGAVAETIQVTPNFITMGVAQLQKKALLTKRKSSTDKRVILLSMTAKGRALLHSAIGTIQAINNELFKDLSADEFQALRELARRLLSNGQTATLLAQAFTLTGAGFSDYDRGTAARPAQSLSTSRKRRLSKTVERLAGKNQ